LNDENMFQSIFTWEDEDMFRPIMTWDELEKYVKRFSDNDDYEGVC